MSVILGFFYSITFGIVLLGIIFWDLVILLVVTIIAVLIGKNGWGKKGAWIAFGMTTGLYALYSFGIYFYHVIKIYPYCKEYHHSKIYTSPKEWKELMQKNKTPENLIKPPKKIIFQGQEFKLLDNSLHYEQFKEYFSYKEFYFPIKIEIVNYLYIDINLNKILFLDGYVDRYRIENLTMLPNGMPTISEIFLEGLTSSPCEGSKNRENIKNYSLK